MKRFLLYGGGAALGAVLCAGAIVAQRNANLVAPTKHSDESDDRGRSERLQRGGRDGIGVLSTTLAQDLRGLNLTQDKVAEGMLQQMERAGKLFDRGDMVKGAQLMNMLAAVSVTGTDDTDGRIVKAYLSMGEIAERASLSPNLQMHFLGQAVRWMNPEAQRDLMVSTIQRISGMLTAMGDVEEAARLAAMAAEISSGLVTQSVDLGLELELQSPAGGFGGGGGSLGPDQYETDNDLSAANGIGFRNNGNGQGGQQGRDNSQTQTHTMWPEAANNFDDIDVVKFELNRPSLVRIETAETDDPSEVDTIIGLSNANGQVLAANDDQAPGNFTSKIELCLPGGEEWFVSTVGFFIGQIFEYDITVDVDRDCAFEDEPNGSCSEANALGVGGSLDAIHTSGFISGDQDWYSFSLAEPKFVSIATGGIGTATPDTTLSLYDGCPNGALIDFDDDGGPGLLSLIQVALDPGTYYVNAQAFSAGAYYAYSISLEVSEPPVLEGNPNGTCAEAAANNAHSLDTTVLASINPANEYDYFLVTVPTAQAAEFETMGSLDTVMNVSSADGSTEFACDDDGGPGLLSFIGCCLPAGDYCVGVKHFSNFATGNYELDLRSGVSCSPLDPPACVADDGGVFGQCSPF